MQGRGAKGGEVEGSADRVACIEAPPRGSPHPSPLPIKRTGIGAASRRRDVAGKRVGSARLAPSALTPKAKGGSRRLPPNRFPEAEILVEALSQAVRADWQHRQIQRRSIAVVLQQSVGA